jgi:starvation-inducible DNA-binding protein
MPIAKRRGMNNNLAADLETSYQDEVLIAEDRHAITQTNHPLNPVVQHLQHQLANAIVLFLNFKMCGWKAEGHSFFGARAAFSQLAEQMKDIFDELGDRLRMIGQDPEVGLEYISEEATVKQTQSGSPFENLLADADANAIIVIREIRDALRDLRRRDEDPGSVELLVSILRVYEQHEWFLRELVKPTGVRPHA